MPSRYCLYYCWFRFGQFIGHRRSVSGQQLIELWQFPQALSGLVVDVAEVAVGDDEVHHPVAWIAGERGDGQQDGSAVVPALAVVDVSLDAPGVEMQPAGQVGFEQHVVDHQVGGTGGECVVVEGTGLTVFDHQGVRVLGDCRASQHARQDDVLGAQRCVLGQRVPDQVIKVHRHRVEMEQFWGHGLVPEF